MALKYLTEILYIPRRPLCTITTTSHQVCTSQTRVVAIRHPPQLAISCRNNCNEIDQFRYINFRENHTRDTEGFDLRSVMLKKNFTYE